MIHKTLHHLIFWSCTALFLLLSGCASTPDYNDDQVRFEAGKEAFLTHQYVQAARLFEPLAIMGHSQAQYTLGYLYYYGLGISQNSEVGRKWISSSAAKGNKLALKALELISKEQAIVKEKRLDEVEEVEPVTATVETPITIVKPPTEVVATHHPITPPETAPTTQLVESKSDEPKPTDWIFDQPAGSYTIQLTSLTNEAAAQNFLAGNPLDGVTKLIAYNSQGSRRYGIIYGSFPTYTEAKEALANLPDTLANASPWIRNFIHIQGLLQQP